MKHIEDFNNFETNEARYDRLDLGLSNFYPECGVMGVFDERDEIMSAYWVWEDALKDLKWACSRDQRAMSWSLKPISDVDIIGYMTKAGVRALEVEKRLHRKKHGRDPFFR